MQNRELLALVLTVLDRHKAEDIVEINLHGKSEIADFMVVASGRSRRQVLTLCDKLLEALKGSSVCGQVQVEGRRQGDWVLVDAGDVIVHIFRPEVRDFYQIEKMWLQSANVRNAG
ncbi:MAG: ribosome silencing factor [Rhodobacteraceae bacterium]|nr:ribosome silencing factor [Paracoccaceae bacterium]